MKYIKYTILSFLLILVTGCSEPTIDATSQETIKASIKATTTKLTEAEQKEYQELLLLAAMTPTIKSTNSDGTINQSKMEDELVTAFKPYHGLTAKEAMLELKELKTIHGEFLQEIAIQRKIQQEKHIFNNLRMIESACDMYMLEEGVTTVSFDQIRNNLPKSFESVAGESYDDIVLTTETTEFSVTLADGTVISKKY